MSIKVAKLLFRLYHLIFASRFATCRFTPTCSEYALLAITKHGPAKGVFKALRRLLSCHPFSTRPIYDPA